MQAFFGSEEIKATYLTRVRYHTQMGHLHKTVYYREDNGCVRACAVGAMLHDPQGGHERFPGELGIPESIAYLIDSTFEHAARPYSHALPARVLEAIPVGADLRGVQQHLVLWMLGTDGHGLWRATNTLGKDVLARVAHLYRRRIAGDAVGAEEWAAAARYVRSRATFAWDGTAAHRAAQAAWVAARPDTPVSLAQIARKAVEARTANLAAATAERVAPASWAAIGDRLLALLAAAPQARARRRKAAPVRRILLPVG